MDQVCHLTSKIYWEILCATRHERMTNITMNGLDPVQADVSWTPKYNIVLSWDLLAWISVEGKIPFSFTNFITTPELSGPLYISPDIYHTQITEYSLLTFYKWALFSVLSASNIFLIVFSVRPSPFFRYVREDWSFTDHLSRALPTEKIFYLLRSIRSESLISCSPELVLDILKVIVEWLEVSHGECMRQTSH